MTIKANTNDDGTCPNCGQDMRLPSSTKGITLTRSEVEEAIDSGDPWNCRNLLAKALLTPSAIEAHEIPVPSEGGELECRWNGDLYSLPAGAKLVWHRPSSTKARDA